MFMLVSSVTLAITLATFAATTRAAFAVPTLAITLTTFTAATRAAFAVLTLTITLIVIDISFVRVICFMMTIVGMRNMIHMIHMIVLGTHC